MEKQESCRIVGESMYFELKENKPHGTKDNPFSIYHIENAGRSFQIPVHWHDELEIIYVKSGLLTVSISGEFFWSQEAIEDYKKSLSDEMVVSLRLYTEANDKDMHKHGVPTIKEQHRGYSQDYRCRFPGISGDQPPERNGGRTQYL